MGYGFSRVGKAQFQMTGAKTQTTNRQIANFPSKSFRKNITFIKSLQTGLHFITLPYFTPNKQHQMYKNSHDWRLPPVNVTKQKT